MIRNCNIPDARTPWDYCRVTIFQSRESLIPSITQRCRQSALLQTVHPRWKKESSEMSIGTCWIPQVAQCATGCTGPLLFLRLYAKFALSDAQRRGPRLLKPSCSPFSPHPHLTNPRHTHTHTGQQGSVGTPRLIYL